MRDLRASGVAHPYVPFVLSPFHHISIAIHTCRLFTFAGLLKVLQLSLPGGSAGLVVLAGAKNGWWLQAGVPLGLVAAVVGLGLMWIGRAAMRANPPWPAWRLILPAVVFIAGCNVGANRFAEQRMQQAHTAASNISSKRKKGKGRVQPARPGPRVASPDGAPVGRWAAAAGR